MDTPDFDDLVEDSTIEIEAKGAFYKDAAEYWSQIPPTVDGMLGGYGFISRADILGSTQFLRHVFRLKVCPGKERALDCGAGIGRITKDLLTHHFQRVDLVEQNPAFVVQARSSLETHAKMGEFYCSGLQDFTPEPEAYDVIWCQWVLGHLTNEDLILFLNGCIRGLKENGVIILKENVTTSGHLDVDSTDSSVTRPLDMLCQLLEEAGLKRLKQKRQDNFPPGLYPVYMIATRPGLSKGAPKLRASSPVRSTERKEAELAAVEVEHNGHADYATHLTQTPAEVNEAPHVTLDKVDLTDESDLNENLCLQAGPHPEALSNSKGMDVTNVQSGTVFEISLQASGPSMG